MKKKRKNQEKYTNVPFDIRGICVVIKSVYAELKDMSKGIAKRMLPCGRHEVRLHST
jgi:hypothetical protein